MTVFIIIYSIVNASGDRFLTNPTKHVVVLEEEKNLAEEIKKIKSLGHKVNFNVYEATPREFEYWTEPMEYTRTEQVPFFRFISVEDARLDSP